MEAILPKETKSRKKFTSTVYYKNGNKLSFDHTSTTMGRAHSNAKRRYNFPTLEESDIETIGTRLDG